MSPLRVRWVRATGRCAAVLVALLVALGTGLAAAVLVAGATARPAVFLGAGALVAGSTAALCGWPVLHRLSRRPRSVTSMVLAAAGALLFAVAVLKPLGGTAPTFAIPPGLSTWHLATGSQLAYVHLRGHAPARKAPVVVLHGGPGISTMADDVEFFRPLTRLGYDVYIYDQLGAGRSSRLDDPTGYTIDRDVADLEQVRRTIGASRMVLIGHSYGGALAAHYLAVHPDRVTKLVLASPGPLDPDDTSGDRARVGLAVGAQIRSYAAALTPRALLGYALLQVNPAAAHAYLDDAEADRRNDRILDITEPALHCEADQQRGLSGPSGFYALQYPQSATAASTPDVRPVLTGLPNPTLLLKGQCDYLSWRSATEYTDALPNAELVYLEGAGHNLYADRPGAAMADIRAFLQNRSLPYQPYDPDSMPADYRGVQ